MLKCNKLSNKTFKNKVFYIDIPQKFVYIPLDIFREKQHNEGESIHNRLEAWLTFFCRDEPEMILKLIKQYPEFRSLYEDIYELCRNVEELQTQGRTIEEQSGIIQEKDKALELSARRIAELERELSEK